VLQYKDGQRYDAHHDFFNHAYYLKDAGVQRMIDGGRRNRLTTVFWYLSDVEKGGETIFPRAGGMLNIIISITITIQMH
jgi:prolyl 4-hydroxylase